MAPTLNVEKGEWMGVYTIGNFENMNNSPCGLVNRGLTRDGKGCEFESV